MRHSILSLMGTIVICLPITGAADDPTTFDIPAERQNPMWVARDVDGSVLAGGAQDQNMGPCEELGNPTLGPDKRITIELNQRERELVHLALFGFQSDMEHELEGVGGWTGGVFAGAPQEPDSGISSSNPAFFARAFFLNYFIEVNVPSIAERVYGMDLYSDTGSPGDATEDQLEMSLQTITFTACERAGLSIALEKWSNAAWGQMGRHLRLCDHSREMESSSACASFRPLGEAYDSLHRKVEKDQ